jgi:hypothetical protein
MKNGHLGHQGSFFEVGKSRKSREASIEFAKHLSFTFANDFQLL